MVNASPHALRSLIRLTLGLFIVLVFLFILWANSESSDPSEAPAAPPLESAGDISSLSLEWTFPADLGVNAPLSVREEIVFHVDPQKPVRGIVRPLQTFALDRKGNKRDLRYEQFQLDLDREPEIGGLEDRLPLLLVRSGKDTQVLSPGMHHLTLSYLLRGAVSTHEDGVEFHLFPIVQWPSSTKQVVMRAVIPRTVDSNFVRPYFSLSSNAEDSSQGPQLLHNTSQLPLKRFLDDKLSRLEWSLQIPLPSGASLRASLFWPRGAFLNDELPSKNVVVP